MVNSNRRRARIRKKNNQSKHNLITIRAETADGEVIWKSREQSLEDTLPSFILYLMYKKNIDVKQLIKDREKDYDVR